jgi:two-component system sensor histidine kinase SenX3
VGNAIRYSPRGSEVLVSALVEADMVHLVVEDQGRGIPANQLDRIFRAFERGSQAEQTQGLGLGLTIARELAMSLGHSMPVRSIEGRGSAFSLSAPLYAAPGKIDHGLAPDLKSGYGVIPVAATALR